MATQNKKENVKGLEILCHVLTVAMLGNRFLTMILAFRTLGHGVSPTGSSPSINPCFLPPWFYGKSLGSRILSL